MNNKTKTRSQRSEMSDHAPTHRMSREETKTLLKGAVGKFMKRDDYYDRMTRPEQSSIWTDQH